MQQNAGAAPKAVGCFLLQMNATKRPRNNESWEISFIDIL
jgi:hypothetical protein